MRLNLALLVCLLVACLTAFMAHSTTVEAESGLFNALDLAADLEVEADANTLALLELNAEMDADAEAELDAEAEMDAEAENESELELEAESETENELEAEADAEAETESESEIVIEPQYTSLVEADAEAEVDAEADAEVDAEAEAEVEAETEAEAEVDAEVEAEAETEVEAEVEAEAEAEAESEAFVEAELEAETEVSAEAAATLAAAAAVVSEAAMEAGSTVIPAELSSLPMTNLDTYSTFYETNLKVHSTTKYRTTSGARPANAIVLRLHAAFAVQIPRNSLPAGSKLRFVDQIGQAIDATLLKVDRGRIILANKRAIGRYYLEAVVGTKLVYRAKDLFYFVFNPMHSDCVSYVSAADRVKYGSNSELNVDLNEHLFSEFGAIYQGSSRAPPTWIPWAFNQYDMTVIDITMGFLLRFTIAQRADPVRVSRFLTTAGYRVLAGRWDNNYADGNAPWTWTSSLPIFARFVTSQSPVKYGQCWVFSAILVSMARSIGYPTRSVTNMDSAHKYIHRTGVSKDNKCYTHFTQSASGEYTWEKAKDDASIWNFHVWADVWFRRTDIANGNGWQAVDATPQEKSYEGPNELPFTRHDYFNGPASLDALQRLDFNSKYDAAFLSAASNCAKVTRVRKYNSNNYVVTKTDTETVGRYMITKMPDSLCTSETLGQRGYTSVCNANAARSYSRVGTFLEMGAFTNASVEFEAETEVDTEVYAPALPLKSSVLPVRANKDDIGPARFGDNLRFEIKYSGSSAVVYRWTITAEAVSTRNAEDDPTSRLRTVMGTFRTDASGTPTGKPMVMEWDRALWVSSPVQAAFKWTNNFRIRMSVDAVEGEADGAMFFDEIALQINQPYVSINCGGVSEYTKGDTLSCSVALTDPEGVVKLTDAVVGIEVAGQTTASRPEVARFPAPVLERGPKGEHIYTFGGLTAKLDTASSRWVGAIVSISSAELPTMTATELILVKDPNDKSTEARVKPGFFRGVRDAYSALTANRRTANDVATAARERF